MSCIAVDGASADVCANCGKGSGGEGEGGAVKLKHCTACRLVKYCGVDCQRAHRKQHKKACKKRAAELKDKRLYSQGLERHEGDFCPLCTLPIPLPMGDHSAFYECCIKKVCNGCNFAARKRGMNDCPFCRTLHPDDDADMLKMVQARVAKKDPEAIFYLGLKYCHGHLGMKRDIRKAFDLWSEAAELGSIEALFSIGLRPGPDMSKSAQEQQDEAKAAEFYTNAAMQGHVEARHNLGCYEMKKGNYDRAVRHVLISAKMGYEHSVGMIKDLFTNGIATKEQYAEALKGYQDAVEETKSHDRDEAKAVMRS